MKFEKFSQQRKSVSRKVKWLSFDEFFKKYRRFEEWADHKFWRYGSIFVEHFNNNSILTLSVKGFGSDNCFLKWYKKICEKTMPWEITPLELEF